MKFQTKKRVWGWGLIWNKCTDICIDEIINNNCIVSGIDHFYCGVTPNESRSTSHKNTFTGHLQRLFLCNGTNKPNEFNTDVQSLKYSAGNKKYLSIFWHVGRAKLSVESSQRIRAQTVKRSDHSSTITIDNVKMTQGTYIFFHREIPWSFPWLFQQDFRPFSRHICQNS